MGMSLCLEGKWIKMKCSVCYIGNTQPWGVRLPLNYLLKIVIIYPEQLLLTFSIVRNHAAYLSVSLSLCDVCGTMHCKYLHFYFYGESSLVGGRTACHLRVPTVRLTSRTLFTPLKSRRVGPRTLAHTEASYHNVWNPLTRCRCRANIGVTKSWRR